MRIRTSVLSRKYASQCTPPWARALSTIYGLVALLAACGGPPSIDDPEALQQLLAEAQEFDRLQQRGPEGETLYYAPNEPEPYTGWAKEMYSSFDARDQVQRLLQFDHGQEIFAVSWHANGQKAYEVHRQQGEPTGPRVFWYENGQKATEGHRQQGERTGPQTEWYDNGQKSQEGHYERGQPTGLQTAWYDNGQTRSETQYEDGVPSGVHVKWYSNGQKLAEERYENGRLTNLDTWTENGDTIEAQRIDVPSNTDQRTGEYNRDLFVFQLEPAFCGEVAIETDGGRRQQSDHRLFAKIRTVAGRSRPGTRFTSESYLCGHDVVYVEVTHTYWERERRGDAYPAGGRYSLSVRR